MDKNFQDSTVIAEPFGPGVVTIQPGRGGDIQEYVHATLRNGKWGVVKSAEAIQCA